MRRAVFSWVVIAVGVGVVAPNMGAESVAQAESVTIESTSGWSMPAGAAQANSATSAMAPSAAVLVPLSASPIEQAQDTLTGIGVKPSATPVQDSAHGAGGASHCPDNMVEVEGEYCPWLEQKCLRWLDPETKMRCAEFAPTSKCQTKTTKKHFCIDRYEWPNKVGEKPVVMKTWFEAKDSCSAVGKRLCGDSEWTVACEGEEHLPYPYGYARNADACNIDKPHPEVNEVALGNPATRDAEAARLDQRDASGSRESCVSPYGVYDMTGNVDEWVVNESGAPYKSGLKGGYWGPVRTRCRPMTTAHAELFSFYQIGFRCCEDVPADKGVAGGKAGPAGAGTPVSHGSGGATSPADNAPRTVAGS